MLYRVRATYLDGDISVTPWINDYEKARSWLEETYEDGNCRAAEIENDKDNDGLPDTDLELEFTDE
jgi:hypothetical protein